MDPHRKSECDTKRLARHAIAAFGSPPAIWRFTREDDDLAIDVGGCSNQPSDGLVSYTTIGLSGQPAAQIPGVPPQGWELAAVCSSQWKLFPQILAAAAFEILNQNQVPFPGHFLCGIIGRFYPLTTTPNIYFARPLMWPDKLQSLECEQRTVHWLLAVPVSSAELSHLEKNGDAGLEKHYQDRHVNMFDLARGHWAW
jgi:hypothetical protein